MVAGFGGDGSESSFGSCLRCLDCDVDGDSGVGRDSPSEPEDAVDEACFTVELPDD